MRRSSRVEEQVASFLAYGETIRLDPRRMVLAMEGERIISMALWVPSPGRTAVLFLPPLKDHPAILPATQVAIEGAIADAAAAGAVLVQVMIDPPDTVTAAACQHLNMIRLAVLHYMERRPPPNAPATQLPPEVRLESYSPATHALFRQAILGSYEDTLDCPALSSMREIEDVMTGHRAVGAFDPNLWSVVMEGEKPIGCLLLADVPARRALDVVYLGLTPQARGRGIARGLMQRVLAIGCRRGFDLMSLAVDGQNAPALKLYRRFGYGQVAQRVAWVKSIGG